jgi:hypothetical protein
MFLYGSKPFKDEVLCDVSPLEACGILLGYPFMWKFHVAYESSPHNVIVWEEISIGIQKVVLTNVVSLFSTKYCRKVISQARKFVLFMFHFKSK